MNSILFKVNYQLMKLEVNSISINSFMVDWLFDQLHINQMPPAAINIDVMMYSW